MPAMQWFYRVMQIGIVVGVVAFYEVFVFIDEPIQLAPVLIIGVFLALIATAVIYWTLEGVKALTRQSQLPLSAEQGGTDGSLARSEPLQYRRHGLIGKKGATGP